MGDVKKPSCCGWRRLRLPAPSIIQMVRREKFLQQVVE